MKTAYLTLNGATVPLNWTRMRRPRHCRRGPGGRFIKAASPKELEFHIKSIQKQLHAAMGIPADFAGSYLNKPTAVR